jgi:hypothetical protein
VVIVVQVKDDRIEREALLAPDRAPPSHVLETVEDAIEARPDCMRVLRQ